MVAGSPRKIKRIFNGCGSPRADIVRCTSLGLCHGVPTIKYVPHKVYIGRENVLGGLNQLLREYFTNSRV